MTARFPTRAVMKRRSELWWLNAIFLALSILKLISSNSTARFTTRAVMNRRFELWWLNDIFLDPDIRKSYRDLVSKSTKVTASKAQYLIRRAAELAKNELSWLPMGHELNLVWHCLCTIFHKIDCLLGLIQFLAVAYWQVEKGTANSAGMEKKDS